MPTLRELMASRRGRILQRGTTGQDGNVSASHIEDDAGAPSVPGDAICLRCFKPIRDTSSVLFRRGELVHVGCRARELQLQAIEGVDRALLGRSRATRLIADLERQRARFRAAARRRPRRPCPVCHTAATVTDWRPRLPWLTIEGCTCRGFFLWAPLLLRLEAMPDEDREILSERIQAVRSIGCEAWVSTRNGTLHDQSLVVRETRPDQPR